MTYKTTNDYLKDIYELVNNKQKIQTTVSYKEEKKEIEFAEPSNKIMFKRLFSLFALNISLFIVAAILHTSNSTFTGITVGLFLSSIIITYIFILDWIIIPYDTFKTIAKNSIALSVLIFTIACSIWVGIGIGDDYHVERDTNNPNPRYDNNSQNWGGGTTAPPPDNGIEIRRNDGETKGEQQGYPNR